MLGPLSVRVGDEHVILGAAKQRAVLAVLLLEAAHGAVRTERLIDDLWGDDPPANADKALQMHVSKLRRALTRGGAQPIVTVPTGYAIRVDPETIDVHRFQALLIQGRRLREAGEQAGALRAFRQALDLWRGPAIADVTLLGPGAGEAERLEELRAVAQETRIELELAQGDAAGMVAELQALIATHPYRERMHGLLMLALYRAGRQADALAAFRRARSLLVEDLGIEPGAELVRLQDAILEQDTALDVVAPVSRPRAADPAPEAIPHASRAILGRDGELDAALALIARDDVRLVTLTGPGGIGKTRLALELATQMGERSRLVALAATRDAARVLPSVAAAIGAREASEDAVVAALRSESIVLFLDNFEQVIGAASVVASLLAALPSLTAVVTSRAPLRIAGEHELPLPPLHGDAAVELFVQRAKDQDPRFSTDARDVRCIEEICTRIDGLPLAIELAAARARSLRPQEILERIGRRLDLLTIGRRDAPERHRTLRATIAWSHDLLGPDEQRLFAQLGVFRSGCSLDAAEAVADGPVLDPMFVLAEHYLVSRDGDRFGMLETVRDYAAERLEELPDAEAVRRRHAEWCLGLANAAAEELEGAQQEIWFARLDAEQENLRAASAWAVEHGQPEVTLGLVGGLWRFWLARGAAADVRGALTEALAAGRGDTSLRASALNAAGVLAGETGDFFAARAAFEQSLELAGESGDRRQMARALANLGVIAMFTEDYATALNRYGEAGDIWRELGGVRGQSMMCQNLAVVYELMRQFDQAMPLLEQSVELARAAGDRMHIAATVITLARLLARQQVDDPRIPALLREGLDLASVLGERLHIIECLEVTARFAGGTGDPAVAGALIGAADAERERAGAQRNPDEVPFFEETIRELERSLGRDGLARLRERGGSMGLDAAVALALAQTEPERGATSSPVFHLTTKHFPVDRGRR